MRSGVGGTTLPKVKPVSVTPERPATRGGFRILRSADEVAEATAHAEKQLQRIIEAMPAAVRDRAMPAKVRQSGAGDTAGSRRSTAGEWGEGRQH